MVTVLGEIRNTLLEKGGRGQEGAEGAGCAASWDAGRGTGPSGRWGQKKDCI